jgi:ABC-type methionine transport system permease subunit
MLLYCTNNSIACECMLLLLNPTLLCVHDAELLSINYNDHWLISFIINQVTNMPFLIIYIVIIESLFYGFKLQLLFIIN